MDDDRFPRFLWGPITCLFGQRPNHSLVDVMTPHSADPSASNA